MSEQNVLNKAHQLIDIEKRTLAEANDQYEERRKHKYPALKIIEVALKVVGWLDVVFVVYMIAKFDSVIGFLPIIGGIMGAIFTFAFAELIQVALDVEENTHRASSKLTLMHGLPATTGESATKA
jgi:hypothetical protein